MFCYYIVYKIVEGDISFNPNIDVKTFNNILAEPKGAQVFDVREPSELDVDGRFPDATNIPRKTFFTEFINVYITREII